MEFKEVKKKKRKSKQTEGKKEKIYTYEGEITVVLFLVKYLDFST